MDFPARTPPPPYYAVVFTNTRTAEDPAGYAAAAGRMVELASGRPGCLGVESVRDADGRGVTVSYWTDLDAIAGWRDDAEHAEAQRLGHEKWYEAFELRICRVERAYGFDRREGRAP